MTQRLMKFIKKLGSLKLTFFLLIIIAAVSVLGTLIVQQEKESFYSQFYGQFWGKIIIQLGINNLYQNILFSGLFFLLGGNLLACNINSFSPRIFKKKRKLAIFLLHFSVLLVFLGAAVSKIKKDSRVLQLLPNEKLMLEKENFEIIFRKFYIDFYPQTSLPKDYRSEVEIFENGKFKAPAIIRVNHPLKFKGYSFYQSGFEVMADANIVVRHRGKIFWEGNLKQGGFLEIPERNLKIEIVQLVPDAQVTENQKISLNSYQFKNPALLVAVYKEDELIQESWFFLNKEENRKLRQAESVFEFEIEKINPFYATVLQVNRDPGLGMIWSGFSILFLGLSLLLIGAQKSQVFKPRNSEGISQD